MSSPPLRIKATVTADLNFLTRLKNYSAESVEEALDEVSEEALFIAKINSRVDTGAMRDGWERFGEGIGSTQSQMSITIQNETLNNRGQSYTEYHEYGTSRFEAQPMLEPAMRYISDNIVDAIIDRFRGTRGFKSITKSIKMSGTFAEPMD